MLEIAQNLEKLASLYEQRDSLQLQKREVIAQVISPEILAKLDEIDDEFGAKEEAAETAIATLEQEIKADTLKLGSTVKGSSFLAVWSKGRISWDSKGLTNYAQAHPEVLGFRKEGAPSVRIRRVQAKQTD